MVDERQAPLGCKRAPRQGERSEITSFEPPLAEFDVVLFCFVLHELDAGGRARALALARRALAPEGRLALVDHALPRESLIARGLSRFVHGFEPGTARDPWLLEGSAEGELARAGFALGQRIALASSMAFALEACRAPGSPS